MKDNYKDNEKYNPDLIENRFQVMEEKVDDLRNRVDDLSKINNVLIELKHLSQQQAKMIERLFIGQEEQNKKMGEIIGETSQLSYRVSSSEELIESINDKVCKEKERGTIYISEIAKNGFLVVLGAVLTALISMVVIQ